MPDGGSVTIAAENREVGQDDPSGLDTGEYVRIAVTDNGTGISPEHLEKVLEPFFTTKEAGKGSGLGLSMVYGFAKQSNGAFRVESELGRGTTAELWLPRAPMQLAQVAAPASKAKSTTAARRMKVLLVDDHLEVRSTTAAILEEHGHSVTQAANGAEALQLLRDGSCECDLVISDYAMPHQSGTDFLRSARELCPDLPALIITGYAEAEAVRDRPEGVEILLKPFTFDALEAAIARVSGAQAQAVAS
jgi:CheY-like chemotaxis protein